MSMHLLSIRWYIDAIWEKQSFHHFVCMSPIVIANASPVEPENSLQPGIARVAVVEVICEVEGVFTRGNHVVYTGIK